MRERARAAVRCRSPIPTDFFSSTRSRSPPNPVTRTGREECATSDLEDAMSGKVITFMKSGGGVGATTLAVQGACTLRGTNLALLDLDIQYGSAAFQMDVESNASILDLVATPDRIDAALLRGAMVRPHDAFDLLAAPEGIYPIEDVSVAAVNKVIEVARSVYATI